MSINLVTYSGFEFYLKKTRNRVNGKTEITGQTRLEIYDNSDRPPAPSSPLHELFLAQQELKRKRFVEAVVQLRRNNQPPFVTVKFIFPLVASPSNTVEISVKGQYLQDLFVECNKPMKIKITAGIGNLYMTSGAGTGSILFLILFLAETFVTAGGQCIFKEVKNVLLDRNFGYYQKTTGMVVLELMPADHVVFRSTFDSRLSMREMLEQRILTDFTLIAGNGVRIDCHKSVLATYSPIFAAMLQTNCKETRDNVCNFEFSPESVNAFLKFCYYSDLEGSMENCRIALDLLEIGHRFFIPKLENLMLDIFFGKPHCWYTIDVAVNIYIRSLKIGGELYGKLKDIVLVIIQLKFLELQNSEEFIQLQKNEPEIARRLLEQC